MYVEHVTNQLECLPALHRFLLAEMGLKGFFLIEVLFFWKPWLNRIFFPSQPDPLIMGASDIGHGYYGPETGDRIRESNPGPTKRSCCKVRELNPGPTKKIVCKARGLNPGPTKMVVRMIVHAIAEYGHAYNRKN